MSAAYETREMPLAGAIVCCTAILPEQRSQLNSIAAQMGAEITLDLTSTVTHLIAGSVNSAKYRYVAKCREDVKVLSPAWLHALNKLWMKGGEPDIAAVEREHRLPIFYGLKICVTGFDNPEQRRSIQERVVHNGAEYHGDLTKTVTHLIAAVPTGKKYEHALSWGMHVVCLEWLEQSIERGMSLDEACYNPTMPAEERGKDAWIRRQAFSPGLRKRAREAEQSEVLNPLKRKLRRSASSKFGSQSQSLWTDITAGGLDTETAGHEDWTEGDLSNRNAAGQGLNPASDKPEKGQDDPEQDTLDRSIVSLPIVKGIFQGRLVLVHGFDSAKTKILNEHMEQNGATVMHTPADLLRCTEADVTAGFLVKPYDAKPDLTLLPKMTSSMTPATNLWVERCLHTKSLVNPGDHILCRPLKALSIKGFSDLTINSTAFSGIELLHVAKVVALLGATYDEYLTTKTSVLVSNATTINPTKLKYVTEKGIPTVKATWLWDCLRTGDRLPFDDYLLYPGHSLAQKPVPKARHHQTDVPTAPLAEEDRERLRRQKAQSIKHDPQRRSRNAHQRPLPTGAPHPQAGAASHEKCVKDRYATQDPDHARPSDPGSTPLQDIPPDVNSPRRRSTSSTASNAKSSSRTASENPPGAIPADPPSAEPPAVQQKDYSTVFSDILARREAAAERNQRSADTSKKKRQLGRATSNPSTVGDPSSFSRTSSAGQEVEIDAVEQDSMLFGGEEVVKPSQELGWDAPGAQEARERMILAMGGTVQRSESGNVVQMGILRDANDGRGGVGRRRKV
ncbi:hypothetical protein M011DRAFT_451157 [Sporormia fimetaria CBS 119925]|uniref:BRCT domain-containing protein n=1 Tax=Sporormia fimetaria CBS 119925 TaxID=1340428 RepID=A0A6A6V0Y0_9PLEO|nr:hypothetical protein M011DRAFT_451157 [Sporormia fimetaria CBS 119925]